MFDEERELSDRELEGVVAGAGVVAAWGKIGPIVKPILYPTRLSRAITGDRGFGVATVATGCANGVCQ